MSKTQFEIGDNVVINSKGWREAKGFIKNKRDTLCGNILTTEYLVRLNVGTNQTTKWVKEYEIGHALQNSPAIHSTH